MPEQPDLNWRNPEVREAMFDVLRFWLDRGVDGFRLDIIWLLIKDDQFRDNPPNPAYLPTQPDIDRTLSVYNSDRPETHPLIAKMRAVLDGYRERVLIGEILVPRAFASRVLDGALYLGNRVFRLGPGSGTAGARRARVTGCDPHTAAISGGWY